MIDPEPIPGTLRVRQEFIRDVMQVYHSTMNTP